MMVMVSLLVTNKSMIWWHESHEELMSQQHALSSHTDHAKQCPFGNRRGEDARLDISRDTVVL